MTDKIKNKILEAKQRFAEGYEFHDQDQGEDQDLWEWLEGCLQKAKERRNNDVLVHLALIGKAMEERPDETIPLTLHHQEVQVALFLARAFKDITAVWYLKDLSYHSLRKISQRKFYKILHDLEEPEDTEVLAAILAKRSREENLDQQPSKKQKFTEFELNEDFDRWLRGENEFLEGIDA